MLRADHQLRLTETKELALNSSFSVPSSSLHNSQIRTLRGGQQAGAPSTTGTEGGNAAWIQNVIRGKGKGTTAPSATTPTASRQNSLFVDTLGLRINNINIKGENSNNDDSPGPHAASTAAEPDTPNSTGSATSTARALLSRFLGN